MNCSGVIYADASQQYDVNYLHDIIFAHRKTGDLTLQLLLPSSSGTKAFPLVIDVPGSGWSGADGHRHVPLLVSLAQSGYAVACISYRGTFRDNVRFPAAVQDLKEAIRFMRANAEKYHIDPERIALFGDSSGGHTVILGALTENDPRFNIGEHLDIDATVSACVAFYAPNNFPNLVADRISEGKKLRPGEGEFPFEGREIYADDFYTEPHKKLVEASAYTYLESYKKLPPFIFLQGDDDPIIPMRQGLRFCENVREHGGRAEFFKIAGGGHGRGCFSPQTMALVIHFLNTYMK